MSFQQAERGAGERPLAGGGPSRQVPGTRPERAMRSTSAGCAFRSAQRGGTTIESALALVVLVVALAGLMEIVNTAFATDRMNRAARAAARALALDASADWCAAIRRELRLDEAFDCDDAWTVAVDHGVAPGALPRPLTAAVGGEAGELVLVRIEWTRRPWTFRDLVPATQAAPADPDDEASPNPPLTTRAAVGLARSEPTG